MPVFFSLAVHYALEEVQAELFLGERLFAFLDCIPEQASDCTPGRREPGVELEKGH